MSVTFVLAMLLVCAVPLFSDDADATDYGDYIITIPQHEGPDKINHVFMSNGELKTIVIYILNDCDCNLDIGLYTVSDREEIPSSILRRTNPVLTERSESSVARDSM